MRGDRLGRRGEEALRVADVDALDHRHGEAIPRREGVEDLLLALAPMGEVLAELGRAVVDDRTMGGVDAGRPLLEQALEGRHVVAEIARLGGDDRRADAEHVVAAEERALLLEQEAEVVGRVSGRVDRAERCALGPHDPAVGERLERALGQVVGIRDGDRADAAVRSGERMLAGPGHLEDGDLAEPLADLIHAADVVGMGVGEDDALDALDAEAGEGVFEDGPVPGEAGSRVEQQARGARAHEIGIRAGAREEARILTEGHGDALREHGEVRQPGAAQDLRGSVAHRPSVATRPRPSCAPRAAAARPSGRASAARSPRGRSTRASRRDCRRS